MFLGDRRIGSSEDMESEPNERQEVEETKEAESEEDIEEKTTKAGTLGETAEGKPLKQDESVQLSIDEECPSQQWDEHAKERFDTAVFTLGTCAAVFAVYIYIVYSLSSPPTVLHRV